MLVYKIKSGTRQEVFKQGLILCGATLEKAEEISRMEDPWSRIQSSPPGFMDGGREGISCSVSMDVGLNTSAVNYDIEKQKPAQQIKIKFSTTQ